VERHLEIAADMLTMRPPISATMSSTWASFVRGRTASSARLGAAPNSVSLSVLPELASAERASRFTLQQMMAILP
jgi:hypothetical protein